MRDLTKEEKNVLYNYMKQHHEVRSFVEKHGEFKGYEIVAIAISCLAFRKDFISSFKKEAEQYERFLKEVST